MLNKKRYQTVHSLLEFVSVFFQNLSVKTNMKTKIVIINCSDVKIGSNFLLHGFNAKFNEGNTTSLWGNVMFVFVCSYSSVLSRLDRYEFMCITIPQ